MPIDKSSPNPRPAERYGRIAQLLHWLTAILVLVAFVYGPGGPEQRVYDPARDFDRHLHETLGSCVFALTLLRIVWRRFDTRPAPQPAGAAMALAARAMQAGLYLLLLAVPLTAVAGAWLQGHALAWLGGIEIAPPLAESHALGTTLAALHGWLGDAIVWLAGLHALAALYHHVLLKDGVLTSMLPLALGRALSRRR